MQRLDIRHFPRFRDEMELWWPRNSRMGSREFEQLMLAQGYHAQAQSLEQWGIFYLEEQEATMFVLRWS